MDYVNLNVQNIIDLKPDIIILGFGMNDHILKNIKEQKDYFYNNYSSIIKKFKSVGIDRIILFGFPQQNIKWEKEYIRDSILYNKLIEKIGKENNIEFIDIYSVFNNIKNKSLDEEIYGDFMHHPNSFGHKIYFSTLIPYFLKSDIYDTLLRDYIDLN